MPGFIRRLVHVLASVALLSLALVFVESTVASAGASPVDSVGQLTSVSCMPDDPSYCVAVDDMGNAVIYNGSSWSSPSGTGDTNYLTSVSCPEAELCVAVDGQGDMTSYVGPGSSATNWHAIGDLDGSNRLNSVSCPKTTLSFCAAVDSAGNALTGPGPSLPWSSDHIDGSNALTSVSCASASFCVAVDTAGNAVTYNGSMWMGPSGTGDTNALNSVSCASASFCVAVDNHGNAVTYNGSMWVGPSGTGDINDLTSVSCPSASFCAAVDSAGDALTYNGSSWWSPTHVDGVGNDGLTSVSCYSANFCGAVDIEGDALTSNALPTTSVAVPSNGATLSGSTDLSASASSNTLDAEFRLFGGTYGDDAPVVCTATLTAYGWLCPWNTTTVPDGYYTLKPVASNLIGTTYGPGVNIAVNNTNSKPTTSVLIPSTGATLSGSTYLDAAANNAASVQFWIIGGSYGYAGKMIGTATPTIYGYLYYWNTTTVPPATYVLLSKATNPAGSVFSPVGVTIRVT